MQNKPINVDLQTLENKDYVVLSSQLKQINDKKEFDQQIVGFNPDTLYFDFSNRAVKGCLYNWLSADKISAPVCPIK